jgi:hypothetical protein
MNDYFGQVSLTKIIHDIVFIIAEKSAKISE